MRLINMLVLGVVSAALVQPVKAQMLSMHHVRVGQGDATLIVGPTGQTCLIDAGPAGQGIGKVMPLLTQLGIATLDYLVVTHYHDDHYGAVPEIVAGGFLPAIAAYDRGSNYAPTSNPLYNQYTAAIAARRTTIASGTVIDLGGGAVLTCVCVNGLAANGAFAIMAGTPQDENARSVALRLSFGMFQAALCGDLTGGAQGTANMEAIVAPLIGGVDVLKVSHHGALDASSAEFLGTLAPEIAVISAGVPWYPEQGTLNLLLAQPTLAALYRLQQGSPAVGGTILNGTLRIETDGASYSCWTGQAQLLSRGVDENYLPPVPLHHPGDVVVSEFMANPAAVTDPMGEWLELRNTTSTPINLLGFTIRDYGMDYFVVSSLVLPAGGHVVLGQNNNPSQNGGYVPAFTWPQNAFTLANAGDQIEVLSPQGFLLDSVIYSEATFPHPVGASVERINAAAPSWATNFAASVSPFGAGDHGTPGSMNDSDHTAPAASLVHVSGPVTPGGMMSLTLTVAGCGGLPYQLLVSDSLSPAIVLPADGRTINLAWSPVLLASLELGSNYFAGFAGQMSALGEGAGAIHLPYEPLLIGIPFHAAAVVIDASFPGSVGSIAPTRSFLIH